MESEDKTAQVEDQAPENDERDSRSIFIGNVDYSTSTEELRNFFKECGDIERVTIPTDKFSKHPKGYAYIEFTDPSSVIKAESFNEKVFKNRKLKILPKRNNIPSYTRPRGFRSFSRRSYFFTRSRSRFRPY